jgi:hypothetical protein
VHNEGFIVRIAVADKIQRSCIQACFPGFNASAVIEDETKTDGNIFMLEDSDPLVDVVFRNLEVLLLKATDRPTGTVHHGNVQFDQVHIDPERARNYRNFRILGLGCGGHSETNY